MAATQKKKTSTHSRSTRKPARRPIRREVGAGVCALLALCVIVGYCKVQAIFIDVLKTLLCGLFGYGYYIVAPALLIASVILLFHHGRPVTLRTVSALLLPVWCGSLVHTAACGLEFTSSVGILKELWNSGLALESGGCVSGAIAAGFIAVFSRVASIIIFAALLVVALVISMQNVLRSTVKKIREYQAPAYEVEEIEPTEPAAPRAAARRPRIDIPLDGEKRDEARKEKSAALFAQRASKVRTPDEVLSAAAGTAAVAVAMPSAENKAESTSAHPAAVAAVNENTVSPSVPPVAQTAAAPAPTPAAGKNTVAADELERAADEVAAEIAQGGAQTSAYTYPPITLLDENMGGNETAAGAELRNNSRRLAETLRSFGVDAKAGDVVHGPSVTRYEFILDQGVKLSKITNLTDDIALALGASGVRIAPIPDKISVVGIEVPNRLVTPVRIRDVIESRTFTEHKSRAAFAIGKDIAGNQIVGDISKLPHVLIAGTTGSGKSVCTNSLIVSLLYKYSPEDVRFIMVDPKMVELAPYNGIPHLLIPVVTDPKKAAGALQWAVFEMMKRYKSFSEHGVKDLPGFNAIAAQDDSLAKLPTVVVVIDELADLMLVAAKEVEESICRVAQMGRAAGIHLVIATQRPSADVITGLMKANIPSRIAFAVASSLESRIILDTIGAEKLVGKGDMLYAPLGEGKPRRVQGCFISPAEIERVVTFVKENGEANYSDEVIAKIEQSVAEKEKNAPAAPSDAQQSGDGEYDELFDAAVEVILETGQASVSMLQRRLKLGYSRAARLVDQMEERGIVGPFEGSKPRQLCITREQWQQMQMGGQAIVAAPESAAESAEPTEE